MQKDYDKIKEKIKSRIKEKEILLDKVAKEKQDKEEKEKEIKELISMERAINESLERNKEKNKILEKIINYYKTNTSVAIVQTVFYIGSITMLIQKQWLPLIFCLVFPLFVPMLMKRK